MSKETLDQFIQQISDSEELQARLGEEIDIDSLIALGAENGCEFTPEDLTQNLELSDEELDGVAGGFFRSIEGGGVKAPTGNFKPQRPWDSDVTDTPAIVRTEHPQKPRQ